MRLCPVCSQPMRERKVYTIAVNGCDRCGGAWFDHHELTELAKTDLQVLGRLDAEFRPVDPETHGPIMSRRCPGCAITLEPKELRHAPGVTVDVCPRCCGIWLEDTELTAIQEVVGKAHPTAGE